MAGTDFFLNCTVSGPGPYQIEWQKVPGPLSPTARDNNGVLRIDQVTLADAGVYKCVVSTPNGLIEESTTVRVYCKSFVISFCFFLITVGGKMVM